MLRNIVVLAGLLCGSCVFASTEDEFAQLCLKSVSELLESAGERAVRMKERSEFHLLQDLNEQAKKHRPGIVLAAETDDHGHYEFVWRRDSGLVMAPISRLYHLEQDKPFKKELHSLLTGYVGEVMARSFPAKLSGEGLSGVKYNLHNVDFVKASGNPWMEPQHDGPAIEALTVMNFVRYESFYGHGADWVAKKLTPPRRVVDKDHRFKKTIVKEHAEHLLSVWNKPGYDLWESTIGKHFHTLMVQRRALIEAAEFAGFLGDKNSEKKYLEAVKEIQREIEKFDRTDSDGLIIANREVTSTLDPYKFEEGTHKNEGFLTPRSGLDISVILGVLHGTPSPAGDLILNGSERKSDDFMTALDDRVIMTAFALETYYRTNFFINKTGVGTAMGRFPEDKYDGANNWANDTEGHAWFLATAAMAELHYRMAYGFFDRGHIVISRKNRAFFEDLLPGIELKEGRKISAGSRLFDLAIQSLVKKGDSFLSRIDRHSSLHGEMAEQFSRYNGLQVGPAKLNWSYASVITAVNERLLWQRVFQPTSK